MLVKMALIIFLVIPIIVLIIFGCIQYKRLAAEAEDEALREADQMRETFRET